MARLCPDCSTPRLPHGDLDLDLDLDWTLGLFFIAVEVSAATVPAAEHKGKVVVSWRAHAGKNKRLFGTCDVMLMLVDGIQDKDKLHGTSKVSTVHWRLVLHLVCFFIPACQRVGGMQEFRGSWYAGAEYDDVYVM